MTILGEVKNMIGKRNITEEQYERAIKYHNGHLANEDYDNVFSISEQIGYGIYVAKAGRDEQNKPVVTYVRGDSCD